jgi:peptidoglycan/LPS O-acetylase OafA/YrhL
VALGDASYSVYLVHYVLIDAFSTVWPQVGSSYALVFWSAACACIIPFVCVGVYNFIEKPLFTGLRNLIIKRPEKRVAMASTTTV